MEQDSLKYDCISSRPLPKWLIDQKEGLNTIQPQKIIMKDDKSLQVSFAFTGLFILLIISILTIYTLRKNKKNTI